MSKRVPEETRDRAGRLVLDHLSEYPTITAVYETVSVLLRFEAEPLRRGGCGWSESMTGELRFVEGPRRTDKLNSSR